jgi:hypothetical protein
VVSLNELKVGLENKLSLKLTQRQAKKVMELFDDSKDGSLQKDEMVSLGQFKYRLKVLMADNERMCIESHHRRSSLTASTQPNKRTSIVSRLSSSELSTLALHNLEKDAQAALEEVAREQDQIIQRGTMIEEALEKALGDASHVIVDVW